MLGLAGAGWSVAQWAAVGFGPITTTLVMRVLTFSLVMVAAGVQMAFTWFLLGIIDMPMRRRP